MSRSCGLYSRGQVSRVGDIVEHINLKFQARVMEVLPGDGESPIRIRITVIKAVGDVKAGNIFRDPVSKHRLIERDAYYSRTPTDTHPNNPNTKENTDMNTQHVTNAINSFEADEAKEIVKPVFKRIRKLVRKVKIGEAIVVERTTVKGGSIDRQFYCRDAADTWLYGNGHSHMTESRVISTLVEWEMADEADIDIERLVPKS